MDREGNGFPKMDELREIVLIDTPMSGSNMISVNDLATRKVIVSRFSEPFEHFVPPDGETIRRGIVDGLVVLDSNVLLSAYRFAPKAREELLAVLELLGDRLWVPHQVGLEFYRNRLNVIADYDAAYKDVLDTLGRHESEIVPELRQKIRELSNRIELADDERDGLLNSLTVTFTRLNTSVVGLRDSHGVGTHRLLQTKSWHGLPEFSTVGQATH
ncbi:PIN-like domain-containing protein [Actinoplanes sp. NPDC049118]|uniref:PIN-like domain-containing protein n=1 Tax=Actinoplanes sp. NPDC049118 TaxID=3155769 RepID=UPI00340C3252